jgi:hypothetical protein
MERKIMNLAGIYREAAESTEGAEKEKQKLTKW